jgi:hypothetical protein
VRQKVVEKDCRNNLNCKQSSILQTRSRQGSTLKIKKDKILCQLLNASNAVWLISARLSNVKDANCR